MFKKSKRKADNEMSKVSSKSITKIVISIAIAAALFIGMTVVESYILSDKQTANVYIAKDSIASGTIITKDNMDKYFEKETINKSLKTNSTYEYSDDIEGKTIIDIDKGEIISANMFLDTKVMSAKVTNPVEVTFSAKDVENSVVGSLREGDTIDIIATYSEAGINSETTSTVEYENVYIIKSYDESYKPIDSNDKDATAMYFKIQIERENETAFASMMNDMDVTVAKTNIK